MSSPPDPSAERSSFARLTKREVDELVIEHLPAMLRFARRLTGDAHTAEEVVQQTLCRVFDKWSTCQGAETFRAWMMQLLVNIDRDRRRRVRPASHVSSEEIHDLRPRPEEKAIGDELHNAIRTAIDRLPARQREVALLKYGEEDFDVVTIAKVLEISTANVYSCLHLARKSIAEAIDYHSADQPIEKNI
ncbi:MAG: sigma-70 family RNA polymerase sigma factor [Lacipirellulaceae bacterium]